MPFRAKFPLVIGVALAISFTLTLGVLLALPPPVGALTEDGIWRAAAATLFGSAAGGLPMIVVLNQRARKAKP